MEFRCVVVDADILSFVVNDTSACLQSVMNKGFKQSINKTRGDLTATALTQYNNTKIKCAATRIKGNKHRNSSIGILLVQGKLLLRLISLY